MHGARLATAVVGMVLASCLLIIPPASAAEEYDITNCGASTITTLSSSAEVTMLAIDSKGVAFSNHPKKAFDNLSFHSVSLIRIVAGQRAGTTFARYIDADGDTVVGETTYAPTEATWRFLEGSGKWKGITGGGKVLPLTNAKPILPGTSQGCVRATGTYEIRK
jgi:hypothetical protein